MGDGQEPASAEPVVEAGPAAPEGPVPRLSPEALDQFNNLANDPVARAKALAATLGLHGYETEARAAVKLDYYVNLLSFCHDIALSREQISAVFELGAEVFDAVTGGQSLMDVQGILTKGLVSKTSARVQPGSPMLSFDDVKKVSAFFASGILQHFRLFQLVYTQPQMETRLTRVVHLDQPRPFRPLSESLIEADHNHMLTRIAEEKRAAEILASAQEAERLAQEEKRRKEEEAAAAAAAEEEALKRKPKTLEEAVEKAVRLRVEEERQRLLAEFQAREAQLLAKIEQLQTGE